VPELLVKTQLFSRVEFFLVDTALEFPHRCLLLVLGSPAGQVRGGLTG
jgi:hypothetical protein